ncbi:transposase [Proteiniphilum propionicum]|uniref:transposase n=1 Tax=Proteiniphilum propionicum TaxID=2829812 RepID=UPI0021121C06|nr:transposase [Proteiniphilum propionicum]ULB35975.1 transposase [Proteiniphilum propionicum]
MSFTASSVKKEFSSEQLTSYSGLSVTSDFINHCGIYRRLEHLFPTTRHNASRFSTAQILSSVLLASLCGVHRLKRIENFTFDALVSRLLKLPKNIDEDTIRRHLTGLGERGARSLHELLLDFTGLQVSRCGLKRVTLDCDSSTFTVYGNQQGAEVGYNSHKKGAKSYHPILCFVTEMKLLVNSWLRPVQATPQTAFVNLSKKPWPLFPKKVEKVFFRADSGFFQWWIV